jgi:hypothetical protein
MTKRPKVLPLRALLRAALACCPSLLGFVRALEEQMNKLKRDKRRKDKTTQAKTRQEKTRHDKRRQDKNTQDKIRQDKKRKDETTTSIDHKQNNDKQQNIQQNKRRKGTTQIRDKAQENTTHRTREGSEGLCWACGEKGLFLK